MRLKEYIARIIADCKENIDDETIGNLEIKVGVTYMSNGELMIDMSSNNIITLTLGIGK
jgi:hypothetical protein